MSERGGRYERSFGGLVGAIIVIVAGVVLFVVYTGLFRNADERELPTVAYLDDVFLYQDAGLTVVYPADLPAGWRATAIEYKRDDPPVLRINLFTSDDEFVGLLQSADEVDDLLTAAGVDDAKETDPLTGAGGVADPWTGWADPDGDRAYTATVGADTVVVYGDVSADDLADVVGRLTTDPAPTPTPTPVDPG